MFEPVHPSSHYRLRNHRLNSRSLHLSQGELVEIRAAQRTFEGAYFRTSLSLFSFALIILKIFTREFYPIGVLFAVYGAFVLMIAGYRRAEGNRQFFTTTELVELEHEDSEQQQQGRAADSNNNDEESKALRRKRTKSISVETKKFRTSGNVVIAISLITVSAYVFLLWLVLRLKPQGSSAKES